MRYFLAVIIMLSFSCVSSPREKGYALTLAQQYYSSGNDQQALELYSTFYGLGGLEKEDLHNYIVMLLNSKRYSRVVEVIEGNGLAIQGRIAKYYGYALFGLDRVDDSFKILEQAHSSDPGDVSLALRYSQLLDTADRKDDSVAVLLETVNTGDESIAVLLLEREIVEGWDMDIFTYNESSADMVIALIKNKLDDKLRIIRDTDLEGSLAICRYFILSEAWDKAEYWFEKVLEKGEKDIVEIGGLISVVPEERRDNFFLLLKEYFGAPFFL